MIKNIDNRNQGKNSKAISNLYDYNYFVTKLAENRKLM